MYGRAALARMGLGLFAAATKEGRTGSTTSHKIFIMAEADDSLLQQFAGTTHGMNGTI